MTRHMLKIAKLAGSAACTLALNGCVTVKPPDKPIEQAAGYLHSLIESLTDVSRISFVVHSMGGLVVRRYLKDHCDPRIHRMVMLGTPNSGAELADMLKRNMIFKTV